MAHMTPIGALLLVVAVLGTGCGGTDRSSQAAVTSQAAGSAALVSAQPAELRVTSIMIGRRIGAGNRITEPSFEFAPQETVHVSVGTEGGSGAERLTAAWRSQSGEILQQSSEPVRPAGEHTAVHLSQAKGFKPGTYKVVLFLGEDSVDTKVFVVRK